VARTGFLAEDPNLTMLGRPRSAIEAIVARSSQSGGSPANSNAAAGRDCSGNDARDLARNWLVYICRTTGARAGGRRDPKATPPPVFGASTMAVTVVLFVSRAERKFPPLPAEDRDFRAPRPWRDIRRPRDCSPSSGPWTGPTGGAGLAGMTAGRLQITHGGTPTFVCGGRQRAGRAFWALPGFRHTTRAVDCVLYDWKHRKRRKGNEDPHAAFFLRPCQRPTRSGAYGAGPIRIDTVAGSILARRSPRCGTRHSNFPTRSDGPRPH